MNFPKQLATTLLMLIALACLSLSAAAQAPQNLVTGLGPVVSNFGWQNWTAMNRISGSSLLASSPTTRLYMGFVGGTEADINNMVVYTTARGLPVITAVTPVTLNNSSAPTISLADACPGRSIGPNAPCIVALDTLPLALSPLNDYYFVVYFTNDSTNNLLGVAKQAFPTSSMTGSDVVGDRSRMSVGDFIPRGNNTGVPHLLMYVMNQ